MRMWGRRVNVGFLVHKTSRCENIYSLARSSPPDSPHGGGPGSATRLAHVFLRILW